MGNKDPKIPVLIVDDRPENLTSLEALLEDLGLELVKATSGNEALRHTLYSDFALVLLDVQMPEMDGFETAELMRGNPKTRKLPIIFVTAGMKEELHLFKGYEAGAVDYLMKPIEPAILRSKVRIFCELFQQRRELESHEQHLEALVAERTEQLVQAQKMESIGRLAGGVAHEFNNMLSVILGSAELLKEEVPEQAPGRVYLEQIIKAGGRSSEITRQLLAFSRKGVVSPKEVNLNDLIQDSQKMLALFIGEDIRLSFHPLKGLWTVTIDPLQVDQILMNLAANARDAMPEGGELTIAVSNVRVERGDPQYDADVLPGEYVELTVTDTGIGMDQQTRERIFEPFFTTKEVGKGTGLGLSTVYGIVTQGGGFLRVYSKPGEGSTFRIYLPRSCKSSPREECAPPVEQAGSGTILLVEDEEMLLLVVSRQLEEAGYRVMKAATPRQALEIAKEQGEEIDLVVTDVVMPEMNGKELLERIREIRPGVGALFISGYSEEFVVQQGVMEKGMDYVQKPLEMKELNRKIRELLSAQRKG